ncbi:hypothetical protein OIE66_06545 [Nonomuraea sp. NBC_01738]|uniref:hypothetical protein n=1 Tax=Nonomuraea sp. NBC_01738 TaxID=2976003 RepID=UPI002E10748D|nr:hypothetical protein OIE66_06545 [Nonomuraea sp. NBC_01738]
MSDPFDGAVTARDVYGKVIEVGERVAQIDAEVDRVEEEVDDVVARVDDHEHRLEAARWPRDKLTLLVPLRSANRCLNCDNRHKLPASTVDAP